MTTAPLYGKYRAVVASNADPKQIGRIQASVPGVSGFIPSTWAMPCLPAGINNGLFTVPPVGAGVWIEFEGGDIAHPIWVGGYWGSVAEVPVLSHAALPGQGFTLQTTAKNGIVISDTTGILLQTATGATISIGSSGIIITNGQGAIITLSGPSVDVNAGALTVT